MNSSTITKNHLADPEIGFYVCVRLFLEEKRKLHEWVSNQRGMARQPSNLTTKPSLLDITDDLLKLIICYFTKIGLRK